MLTPGQQLCALGNENGIEDQTVELEIFVFCYFMG